MGDWFPQGDMLHGEKIYRRRHWASGIIMESKLPLGRCYGEIIPLFLYDLFTGRILVSVVGDCAGSCRAFVFGCVVIAYTVNIPTAFIEKLFAKLCRDIFLRRMAGKDQKELSKRS